MSTQRIPLGRLIGARSGDKGGSANVGVWVPAAAPDPDAAYAWLKEFLTIERVRQLLPETEQSPIDLYPMDNLRAINIVIRGFLGRGVSENSLLDPQAKGLGELLRARVVDVPAELVPAPEVDLA